MKLQVDKSVSFFINSLNLLLEFTGRASLEYLPTDHDMKYPSAHKSAVVRPNFNNSSAKAIAEVDETFNSLLKDPLFQNINQDWHEYFLRQQRAENLRNFPKAKI